jgi:hypothetical protein
MEMKRMTADPRIEARQRRWREFLSPGAPSGGLFQIDIAGGPERPWPNPWNVRERIDWAVGQYESALERMSWLEDDRVPSAYVYTGTDIFAEAFGCHVHRPVDNMPFALPLVSCASEAARLSCPTLEAEPLARVFAIADSMVARIGPDAILQLPDVQSPLDIAALIWDKSDFYIALMEEPEAVLELCAKIRGLLEAFFDAWFRRYGGAYVAHYPHYYMEGGLTVSEDEVGVIDASMFERFALPDLEALSRRYGGLGMHCCANALHQWSGFLRIPGLRLLNLVQPAPVLREAYRFFAGHVCQMHAWSGEGNPWTWPDQCPRDARIVYSATAETRDEALRIAEGFARVLGR